MFVEAARRFDQIGRGSDVFRQRFDELGDRMTPRLATPSHDECLQRLLRRLLRGERRPLVVAVLDGVLRMSGVALSLIPPVLPAIHPRLPMSS